MDLPLAFQKTKLTEKGVFVKRGIKKTAQEKLLFGGTRPGDFGRVRKIVRTIVDLQTEPILRSGSQFFFNNMELAPSFLMNYFKLNSISLIHYSSFEPMLYTYAHLTL